MNNLLRKALAAVCVLTVCVCAASAASLRDYVCVVRTNLPERSVAFLTDYRDALKKGGYSSYADYIDTYIQTGMFGSGFVYYAADGKPYVVTNRHVVEEAETVTVQFEKEDGSFDEYAGLSVVAADESLDVALIALPASFSRAGLTFAQSPVDDGDDVWSAGFPALDNKPLWQLGKGNVTNSRARMDDLLSSEISTLIQHSAPVAGGNSGGPLLVRSGSAPAGYAVVGINTWKATTREATGFAIPAAAVASFVADTVRGRTRTVAFDARMEQFAAVLSAQDSSWTDLARYVSTDMIALFGSDGLVIALRNASSSDADIIATLFAYDPISGMRYAIAYDIWLSFRAKRGGALPVTAGEADEQAGDDTRTVLFTPEGKAAVSTVWTLEQGNWKLKECDAVSAQKASSANGIGLYNPYKLSVGGGALYSLTEQSWGWCADVAFTSSFVQIGLFLMSQESPLDAQYGTGSTFLIGADLRLQVPLYVNRILIVPYGKLSVTMNRFSEVFERADAGLFFGLGGGIEVGYAVTRNVAPFVGFEFQHSVFSFAESTNVLMLTAGAKLSF